MCAMPLPPDEPATEGTAAEALANARRLLYAAEAETNLPLMERLEKLADSWIQMAALIVERDRA